MSSFCNPIAQQFLAALKASYGAKLSDDRQTFHEFVSMNITDILHVINQFKIDGFSDGTPFTATTYNDYYKLSMAPTIDRMQFYSNGDGAKIATFAVDIRDSKLQKKFAANIDGITDTVIQALDSLKHRIFDLQVIQDTVDGKPFASFFQFPEGRAIFLNADESPRTLISQEVSPDAPVYPGTCIYTCPIDPSMLAPGQVSIAVFMANDAKTGENRLHIEATGEWSKVSFLETTMMQVVYQTALQQHLQKRGCSFGQWLYEALFRFYLSVRFSGKECPGMTGFLFAGRRTGHFLLLCLQALLTKRIPDSKIAGTSSFDAWHFLTKKMGFTNIIGPVGTHAHELQMAAQGLYSDLDTHLSNKEHLPISACLSLYMYYLSSHQGKPGAMPMLPDTLGTESFCKAASAFWVNPMKDGKSDATTWVPLLSLVNSARQDSGDLGNFKAIMEFYGFKGGLFASEIDTMSSLVEARDKGYTFFGAGGAMGDSEKVWDVTGQELFSASMAAKIVRIWKFNSQSKSWLICRNPVKLGDGSDVAKVTADPLLSAEEYQKVISNAQIVKQFAKKKPVSDSNLFFVNLPNGNIRIGCGFFENPLSYTNPKFTGILYESTKI